VDYYEQRYRERMLHSLQKSTLGFEFAAQYNKSGFLEHPTGSDESPLWMKETVPQGEINGYIYKCPDS